MPEPAGGPAAISRNPQPCMHVHQLITMYQQLIITMHQLITMQQQRPVRISSRR